jgi:DnaK suppressor protein
MLVRLAAACRTKDRERLREALASLRRIRDGSYGYCVRCGLKIPDGELSRAPDRARCATCS